MEILEVIVEKTMIEKNIYHVTVGDNEDVSVAIKQYFHGAKQNDKPIKIEGATKVYINADVTEKYGR